MADAKHTPADDTSFRASLLKQGGGAVAVVAGSALVFWAIGALGGGPLVPSVTDQDVTAPADDRADDDAADDEAEQAPDVPEPDEADEAEDAVADDDGEDAEDGDADADGQDPAADDADGEDDDAPSDDDDAPGGDDAEADAVDPGSVSIQVLDGFKRDGGAAAGVVADELTGIGYRVVARNQALDYDVTTVLFNPGNEAAARRIARDLGGADVREQPGNLSTGVDVHVVVGADRG